MDGTGDTVKAEPARPLREVQDEIVAEMTGLEDGLARYRYLVQQGRTLPSPVDGIRTDENALGGCQTTVWIDAALRDGKLKLRADSDAMITRGILSLLLRVLDGRAPSEVAVADLYFLDRTGLRTHLSPARANGLAAMIQRIRAYASEHAHEPPRR